MDEPNDQHISPNALHDVTERPSGVPCIGDPAVLQECDDSEWNVEMLNNYEIQYFPDTDVNAPSANHIVTNRCGKGTPSRAGNSQVCVHNIADSDDIVWERGMLIQYQAVWFPGISAAVQCDPGLASHVHPPTFDKPPHTSTRHAKGRPSVTENGNIGLTTVANARLPLPPGSPLLPRNSSPQRRARHPC